MSEITETIANIAMTGLALYGFYVMRQLHKTIKRGNKEIDELKEKLNDELETAEWIEKQIELKWCEDDVDIIYECSLCHTDSAFETDYCPNCGTKMKGANDEPTAEKEATKAE